MKELFIQTGSATDVGSVREINEDRILALKSLYEYGESGIFAVADGVGGLGGGDVASKIATDKISEFWNDHALKARIKPISKMSKMLKELFGQINQSVLDHCNQNGTQIATTLTVLYVCKNRFIVAHAGDSRLYLLRRGKILKLTQDQVLVSRKNVLTNCIGKPGQIEVHIKQGKIKESDLFLLCSDGFYNRITDNNIMSILSVESGSIQEIIQGLLSSLKNNARDNLSAVLVKCNFNS